MPAKLHPDDYNELKPALEEMIKLAGYKDGEKKVELKDVIQINNSSQKLDDIVYNSYIPYDPDNDEINNYKNTTIKQIASSIYNLRNQINSEENNLSEKEKGNFAKDFFVLAKDNSVEENDLTSLIEAILLIAKNLESLLTNEKKLDVDSLDISVTSALDDPKKEVTDDGSVVSDFDNNFDNNIGDNISVTSDFDKTDDEGFPDDISVTSVINPKKRPLDNDVLITFFDDGNNYPSLIRQSLDSSNTSEEESKSERGEEEYVNNIDIPSNPPVDDDILDTDSEATEEGDREDPESVDDDISDTDSEATEEGDREDPEVESYVELVQRYLKTEDKVELEILKEHPGIKNFYESLNFRKEHWKPKGPYQGCGIDCDLKGDQGKGYTLKLNKIFSPDLGRFFMGEATELNDGDSRKFLDEKDSKEALERAEIKKITLKGRDGKADQVIDLSSDDFKNLSKEEAKKRLASLMHSVGDIEFVIEKDGKPQTVSCEVGNRSVFVTKDCTHKKFQEDLKSKTGTKFEPIKHDLVLSLGQIVEFDKDKRPYCDKPYDPKEEESGHQFNKELAKESEKDPSTEVGKPKAENLNPQQKIIAALQSN